MTRIVDKQHARRARRSHRITDRSHNGARCRRSHSPMRTNAIPGKSSPRIATHEKKVPPALRMAWAWRSVQYILMLAGFALVATLFYLPQVGLDIFWNTLIPIAPALIVIAPGLWRNICPLATVALLPRRFNASRRIIPKAKLAAWLTAAGLIALLLIVPLRHLSLNTNGPLTALMLIAAAACAFTLSMAYEWRGAWCNSLCPIHPAEKLYGLMPAISVPNARCDDCSRCYSPCPDSTRSMNPTVAGPSRVEKAVGHIMAGGFAGFIWGWYQVPDYSVIVGTAEIVSTYAWPFGCALVTLILYGWAWRHSDTQEARRKLVKVFATAAVCAYYWYRIPLLFGFGPHPGSGMLIDLHQQLPLLPLISRTVTTSFFIWFILLRGEPRARWMARTSSLSNRLKYST